MGKSNVDNNTTKARSTIILSSGQSRTLQNTQERLPSALSAIAEGKVGTYPLTLLGDDEMSRHAFLQ